MGLGLPGGRTAGRLRSLFQLQILLGACDPELQKQLFALGIPAISTARAGNVIGGGDFANDRIIPDRVRAVEAGLPIVVRNPYSTGPYQHVLEPLFAYLMIVQRQYENPSFAAWYNVGPDGQDCVTTEELVGLFCEKWGSGASCVDRPKANAPHEANFLKLDCSKLKSTFWYSFSVLKPV